MASHTDVILDDLGVVTERLQPFAPHAETRRKLHDLYEEYTAKVNRMASLFDGGRLSCPIHEDSEDVIITGHGRNDTKKFICRKYHDPEETDRDTTEFRFSTFTSFEAYAVYRDFLTEALMILATCEGTFAGIAEYLNLSKHMVEYGAATMLDYLDDNAPTQDRFDIDDDEDMIVVYADFSSTRVSKGLSMIMGRIDDQVCYYACPAMNWLTAWNFIRGIDETLGETDATVVFVTDGEVSLIDPIRSFFPEAIHVRQFHSANTRGIIYTHLPVDDDLYTVRCRWDAVLDAGEPTENARRMRRWRKHNERNPPNERSNSESWTNLSEDVFVWEGVTRYPRGTRKKEADTASSAPAEEDEATAGGEATDGVDHNDETPGADHPPPDEPNDGAGPTGAEAITDAEDDASTEAATENQRETAASDGPESSDDESTGASGTDGVDRLFRGSLEEAKNYPAVRQALDVLADVFGGHYITSNAAEALFHLKPALTAHRTVKSGDAFVRLFLFLRTQLSECSRAEKRAFFREEVVTIDRLRSVAVDQHRSAQPEPDPEDIVKAAARDGEPVVISYSDRHDRRTRRMIEPLSITVDEYTGGTHVESYCYLREAERTFLVDRISEAIPVDTDLTIVPADGQ